MKVYSVRRRRFPPANFISTMEQWVQSLFDLKSVNLQYDTLVRWVDGTNDSWNLMFQISFFQSCKQFCKKNFFYEIKKLKIKSFECSKSVKNCGKKILGTSSASTSRLSHQPRKPVYIVLQFVGLLFKVPGYKRPTSQIICKLLVLHL